MKENTNIAQIYLKNPSFVVPLCCNTMINVSSGFHVTIIRLVVEEPIIHIFF